MQIKKLQSERSKQIQDTFQLTSLCARVLAAKELTDEQITELLKKPQLADPFSAKGMQEVAQRIYQARRIRSR